MKAGKPFAIAATQLRLVSSRKSSEDRKFLSKWYALSRISARSDSVNSLELKPCPVKFIRFFSSGAMGLLSINACGWYSAVMPYKKTSIPALHRALDVDYQTGRLTWKRRGTSEFSGSTEEKRAVNCARWNERYSGKEAFNTQHNDGYLVGKFHGGTFRTHRIIWAMKHNRWPVDQLDHINGKRSDNKISNLREVSNSENCQNQKKRITNKSGYTGVYFNQYANAWDATIHRDNRRIRLGTYRKKEDAIKARQAAELEFGYHENHGGRG